MRYLHSGVFLTIVLIAFNQDGIKWAVQQSGCYLEGVTSTVVMYHLPISCVSVHFPGLLHPLQSGSLWFQASLKSL